MTSIQEFPLFIAGQRHTSGLVHKVTSPYHNDVIGQVEMAQAPHIELALSAAEALFRDRDNWLSVPQRIDILERVVVLLRQQADELARGAAAEGGKPLIDSRIEMARCIDSIQICIDELRTQTGKSVPMGINAASAHRMVMMKKEPIGVVVAVSAFNHPLNLIAHQIGPAIASGCPVIVKPAEDTPLSCFRLVDIFYQAGLPAAWCQAVLPENHQVAEQLVTDRRVAFFSFIGSAKVGWYLRSRLAPGTRCALEHGGVAPVIMTQEADLTKAIPALVKGGFYHAGQVCVSVQRIFVHDTIAEAVTQQLSQQAQALVVGDPLSDQTEVGPLIRQAEVERIHDWVQQAVAEGAELRCGGTPLSNQCYAPTVLFHPDPKSKVSTSEIFGPVVCVYPYRETEAAIAQANSLDVAFQAAVFSQDMDQALAIADRLDASAVMLNEHTAFRVDWMPFAGLKHSGLGTGGIPYTMQDMQIDKMIVVTSKGISS